MKFYAAEAQKAMLESHKKIHEALERRLGKELYEVMSKIKQQAEEGFGNHHHNSELPQTYAYKLVNELRELGYVVDTQDADDGTVIMRIRWSDFSNPRYV